MNKLGLNIVFSLMLVLGLTFHLIGGLFSALRVAHQRPKLERKRTATQKCRDGATKQRTTKYDRS